MAFRYVNQSDPNATDSASNTGTNDQIPLRTLTATFSRMQPGDTAIVLDSSNYAEQLTCGLVGTAALPMTWRVETGVTPTLIGALNARWILQLNGAKYTIWDGFKFSYGFATPDPPASNPSEKRGRFPWIQLVGATTQYNKLTNLTITRPDFLGAAISGYAAAGWDEWGIQDSGARYTWIYKCTIGGVGQGVQMASTDFFSLLEDCDIGPTYQSDVTCTSSGGQIAKRWIKNCRLFSSYIEDGIQWIPASGAGVDQTTDKSNVGTYVSDTTIHSCNENGADTKGARLVWLDRVVIYNILGSNNGLESGGNRNSHFGVGRGASTSCSEITVRNSYLYDMPTLAMRGSKYSVYHNVIVNCNKDFTGSSGAYTNTTTPPFKSVFHQDSAISGIISNNILGKNATGSMFMRLGQGEFHIDGNMHVESKPGNWTGSSYSTYSALVDWQAAVQATGWATTGEAGAQFVANLAAVKFRSVATEYLSGPISSYDLTLQSDSPAVGAGKYLQKAIGAGTNSRFITVPYPSAFFDGFGWQSASFPSAWASWAEMQGDIITIKDPSGAGQPRQILNIDYDTGVVEIDEAATWSGGAEIFLGSSITPNLGPLQAGTAGGGSGGGGTGSGTGRKISFRVNCQTSAGDQTISLPVTLANAPKALMFTWNNGVTNGTAANHAILMRGAWVTGGTQRATCILSENGISGQDSARQSVNDACVLILTNANGVDGKATVSSVSTTQIVLNWSNPPASAFPLTITVFDCAEAYLTSATLPTVTYNEGTNVGYTTVTPAFRANEIHLWSEAKAIPGNSARAKFTEGWVSDDGTTTRQAGFTYISNDLASGNNTQVGQQMFSTYVLGELADSANALNRTIQVKNLDATSFRLASIVGDWSGGADAIVLAIRWDGLRTWVGTVDMPTSAVATTFGDPNFLGQHAELFISNLTAADTLDQTGNAGTLAYWTGDGSRETSNAWSDKDNVATSVTRSLTDDNLNTLQHDATAGYTATFTSFEGSGPKLTFSAVLGTARKAILFLVGAAGGQASAMDEGGGDDTATPQLIIQIACTEEGSSDDYAPAATGLTVYSIACTEEGSSDDFGEGAAISPTTASSGYRPPSFGQSGQLSFSLFEPLKLGTQQIDDLGDRINAYSHEISAAGGFWSARLTLVEPFYAIDDWLELGLGRRLVVSGPENQAVWEGFVNRLTVRLGSSQRTVGPLLSACNRVKLVYSYIAAGGADIGTRASTAWASNTTSQARYGILSKVLSTGGATATTAASLRDDFLQQNAFPETDGNLDFGSGSASDATLELELLGYYHYLQSYPVAITTTGITTLSAQLQAVLAQEPNNYLTHEWDQLATNTLSVPAYNNDDRDALSVVKTLIAKGDAADNRFIFGIYENRKPRYAMASQQVDYIQYLGDPSERMIENGQVVAPWDVRPGKWILNPDYLVGRVPVSTELASDPRAEFIESVSFQLPYAVTLRGSKIRRLDQKLARLGLSGLGG